MTTTDEFQKIPDSFDSKADYDRYKSVNTNPRYSNFFQTHFTAGDIDQFETYRDRSNGKNKEIKIVGNVWSTLENTEKVGEHLDWKKYSALTTDAIDQTFLYLFEKFKKGIFVKIKNNKLDVFLPFSKHNYVNEWGKLMKHPTNFKDMTEFLIYASKLQGFDITKDKINKFTNKWYANNCLVRPEFPVGENDRCISNLKDLLLTLCETREVPDIELFFNRRDFPLIKTDDTEPYEHIFDEKLISHKYDKYCPILSMVTTDTNADIPFPTMEDWARVRYQSDKKLFAPDFKTYVDFNTEWKSKKPTAVFRGASTGCGVTVETNPRLKIADLSMNYPKFNNKIPLLDAGITKWNCRPRKISSEETLQVIVPEKMPFKLVQSLTPEQQSQYKYIVNVDGHVSAFRLSYELSMGSVVLLQDSRYRVWFRKYLLPNVHYVPIKEDLSDLYEKIQWCIDHDEECETIAKQAKLFYDTYLTKKGVLDYVQLLFVNIKQVIGTYFYNYGNVKELIYTKQLHLLPKEFDEAKAIFPFDRDINALAGFEMFVSKHKMPVLKKEKRHDSKDSLIQTFQLDKLKINAKTSTRKYELVNETFVGLKCVNKIMKEIPNFKYTFGMQNDVLYTEYVEGILFSEYIKKCSISDLNSVLQILFLALEVAQETCGFVHNDLTCWNIVIKEFKETQRVVYQFRDQIFVVETMVMPVIIDYDRSHGIYDDFHYGIIHPFKSSTVQDCFCIVINAVNQYCMSRHVQVELKSILDMINFLSETEFHKMRLTNYAELMDFIDSNKRYNEIVYRNKCDLETLTPVDFLIHFNQVMYDNKLSSKIKISNIDGKKVFKEYLYVNPLFYYNMIIEEETDDLMEYIDKIEQITNEMDFKNFFYYLHSANQTYKVVFNLLEFVEKYNKDKPAYFVQNRNCKRILTKLKDKMHLKQIKKPDCGHTLNSTVEKVYCPICKKNVDYVYDFKDKKGVVPEMMVCRHRLPENPSIQIYCTICSKSVDLQDLKTDLLVPRCQSHFSLAKYTPSTFSVPSTILTILQGNVDVQNKRCISIWYMVRDTLLFVNPFQADTEFNKYGKMLSKVTPLSILNHNANIKTLRWLSKRMYEIDQKYVPKESKQFNTIQNILALC